ncbi:MAG: acyl carrier protein [Lachnospiraceae bacterium]|nr:acyl carrier protein [Lachnospiraceae bacterium]
MKNEEIFEKLTGIFRDNFDDDSIELTEETTADDIEDWDSLEQINLLSRIEKVFGITFDIKETLTLHNVGEMVNLIGKKL